MELTNNQKVYCVLRRVSNSGMSRNISFFVMDDDWFRCIDYMFKDIFRLTKDGYVQVRGCGMDMGFHAVSTLASKLNINLKYEWV